MSETELAILENVLNSMGYVVSHTDVSVSVGLNSGRVDFVMDNGIVSLTYCNLNVDLHHPDSLDNLKSKLSICDNNICESDGKCPFRIIRND